MSSEEIAVIVGADEAARAMSLFMEICWVRETGIQKAPS